MSPKVVLTQLIETNSDARGFVVMQTSWPFPFLPPMSQRSEVELYPCGPRRNVESIDFSLNQNYTGSSITKIILTSILIQYGSDGHAKLISEMEENGWVRL